MLKEMENLYFEKEIKNLLVTFSPQQLMLPNTASDFHHLCIN